MGIAPGRAAASGIGVGGALGEGNGSAEMVISSGWVRAEQALVAAARERAASKWKVRFTPSG